MQIDEGVCADEKTSAASFNLIDYTDLCRRCLCSSNGAANAGYAVIPMVMALACLAGYKVYTNKR